MKWVRVCCILLMVVARLAAQDNIVVHKDARLDMLTARQAAINKLTAKMTNSGMFKGYRVQVANTRSREEAFKVKAGLMRRFPEYKTYAVFQSPYFKIRVGNFLERTEADEAMKMIARQYPQGVYVVEDVIEYTPPAEEIDSIGIDK